MSLVPVHVAAGVVAIATGFVALYAAKGGTLHRKSGLIFVFVMLVMSLSGALLAVGRAGAALNIPAGLVTAYLVLTGVATVRPASGGSRRLERGAMLAAFTIGAGSVLVAIAGGLPAALVFPLLMFATVATAAGVGDLRMLRAGGRQGADRLRRHLWRMCAALFIASGSFFLGPVRRIPEPLRIPALRLIPFVALATMAYWLWRYRRTRAARRPAAFPASEAI
jgi:uncharacterized membrane protein